MSKGRDRKIAAFIFSPPGARTLPPRQRQPFPMKRLKDHPTFGHFDLFGEAQRKLAGIVGEVGGDFEHDPDFALREAAEDGVESDGEVGLNEHFVSPVRGVIACLHESTSRRFC